MDLGPFVHEQGSSVETWKCGDGELGISISRFIGEDRLTPYFNIGRCCLQLQSSSVSLGVLQTWCVGKLAELLGEAPKYQHRLGGPKKCNCDIMVLMRAGCQCGSINGS